MKVKVPSSWSEITLEQFREYSKVLEMNISDLQKQAICVSIFAKIDRDVIDDMPIREMLKIYEAISETLDTEVKGKFKKIILHDGLEYGFNPDLINETTSEGATYDELSKDYMNNLDRILSIFYRPIKKKKKDKYSIEKFKQTHTKFSTLDMETIAGAQVFFYNISSSLSETILRYTVKNLKKKKEMDLQKSI